MTCHLCKSWFSWNAIKYWIKYYKVTIKILIWLNVLRMQYIYSLNVIMLLIIGQSFTFGIKLRIAYQKEPISQLPFSLCLQVHMTISRLVFQPPSRVFDAITMLFCGITILSMFLELVYSHMTPFVTTIGAIWPLKNFLF
jgi:hypothetical protein